MKSTASTTAKITSVPFIPKKSAAKLQPKLLCTKRSGKKDLNPAFGKDVLAAANGNSKMHANLCGEKIRKMVLPLDANYVIERKN